MFRNSCNFISAPLLVGTQLNKVRSERVNFRSSSLNTTENPTDPKELINSQELQHLFLPTSRAVGPKRLHPALRITKGESKHQNRHVSFPV